MTTHPGEQYLAEQLQAAYDKVKEWPENSETGFMDLLTLRNLVPDAIALLAAEKARADAAEAERVRLWNENRDLRGSIDVEKAVADSAKRTAEATIASLTEQLAEAREALRPFAKAALACHPENHETSRLDTFASGRIPLNVGHLRRARATLSRLEKQEGEA